LTPKNSTLIEVIKIKNWSNRLIYLRTNRPEGFVFTSGQFARISTKKIQSTKNENLVWRAQSITSCSTDKFLEFLIIIAKNGEFSKDLVKLDEGDTLFLDNQNYGYLTLERFLNVGDLWLFATGTGIAPFVSIIKNVQALKKFNKINLIHSISDVASLSYYNEFLNFDLFCNYSEIKKKLTYLPIITQQKTKLQGFVSGEKITFESLKVRFTSMLVNGELEKFVKCELSVKESKIMICGNPEMVKDTRDILKSLGFVTSRRNSPGQIAVENYW
jgi:ferredoxin--NADP+ reductase